MLGGDLTPECAAVVRTVLDALSAPAGAEDARSHEQRCHDALQEAMRPLVAGGLVPPTERGREALEKAIIGKTMFVLLHSMMAL